MPSSTVMSGNVARSRSHDHDVAQIEVIGRHVHRQQRLRAASAVDGELLRQEPEREAAPRDPRSCTTRLNPDSLSGENAATSCLTGA